MIHSLGNRAPIDFGAMLPDQFRTKEAYEIGKGIGLTSTRSVDRRLEKMVESGYLSRPKQGFYVKNDSVAKVANVDLKNISKIL